MAGSLTVVGLGLEFVDRSEKVSLRRWASLQASSAAQEEVVEAVSCILPVCWGGCRSAVRPRIEDDAADALGMVRISVCAKNNCHMKSRRYSKRQYRAPCQRISGACPQIVGAEVRAGGLEFPWPLRSRPNWRASLPRNQSGAEKLSSEVVGYVHRQLTPAPRTRCRAGSLQECLGRE